MCAGIPICTSHADYKTHYSPSSMAIQNRYKLFVWPSLFGRILRTSEWRKWTFSYLNRCNYTNKRGMEISNMSKVLKRTNSVKNTCVSVPCGVFRGFLVSSSMGGFAFTFCPLSHTAVCHLKQWGKLGFSAFLSSFFEFQPVNQSTPSSLFFHWLPNRGRTIFSHQSDLQSDFLIPLNAIS